MNNRLLAIGVTLLMFASVYGMITYIPADGNSAQANPYSLPPSSISNTQYLNTSVNYWENVNISNTSATNLKVPINENGSYSNYNFCSTGSWTDSSSKLTASWQQSLSGSPNFVYLSSSSNTIELDSFAFHLGSSSGAGAKDFIGTIYANISLGSYSESWNHVFNYCGATTSTDYAVITPSWNFYTGTPWYLVSDLSSASITFTATTYNSLPFDVAPYDAFTTTQYQGENTIQSISVTDTSVPFAKGYNYGSVTSSFTATGDLTSYRVAWSGGIAAMNVQYGSLSNVNPSSGSFPGTITSSSQTIKFGVNGDPSDGTGTSSYGISASYYLYSQVQAQQKTTTQSYSLAQSITENHNWWNSTGDYALSPPSGAINNPSLATTSGTINAETTMTWSVNHITVAGYGTSPSYDNFTYSGYQTGFDSMGSSPPQYYSVSESTATVIDSTTSIDYSYGELINYIPSITNHKLSLTTTTPDTPIYLYVNASETVPNEYHALYWSLNGTSYLHTSYTTSNSLESSAITFSTVSSKTVFWYVENDPNALTSYNAVESTSVQTSGVNTVSFLLSPSPSDYSSVSNTVDLSLSYNSQTTTPITTITLTVNGILENQYAPDRTSGTVSYTYSQPVASPLLVTWKATSQYGYVQSITFQYGSALVPAEYSHTVTVLESKTATGSYPVAISNSPTIQNTTFTLSNTPSGTGYYQQLLTIPLTSSINPSIGNFYFTTGNTELYAWVQSYNTSDMSVWVKTPNGTSAITMYSGFPSGFYSANGHIGEAPQLSSVYGEYFNAYRVFPYATDFQSYSEFKGYIDNTSGNVVINNGLNVTQGYTTASGNMGVTLGYAPTVSSVLYTYIASYYLFGSSSSRNVNPQGFGWSQDGGTFYARYQKGLIGNPSYGISEFSAGAHGFVISTISGNSVSSVGLNSIYFNASNYVMTTSPSGYQNYQVSPSTAISSSDPAYAEIGEWNDAYNTTMVVYYSFIATPPNTQDIMPTFTQTTTSAPPLIQNTAHYQQLFTLNYTKYGINSQGSNFLISYSNGSNAYTWIQSINSTSITFWTSLYYSTDLVDLNVFPQFENLFSSEGFLGYNRTYFNAPLVFPYATDFTNLSGFNGNNAYYTINNGLNLSHYGGITSNLSYGSGYFGYQLKITGNAGGNFEYFAVNNRSSNKNGNESILGAGVYNSEYLGYQTRTDSGNKASTANTSYLNNQEVEGYMYIPSLVPSYIDLKVNSKTFNSSTAGDLPVYHQTYLVAKNNNATSWLNMYYWFYSPTTSMPTYTISGGSAFQANATTSSTFSGQSGSMYNATWQYFTYDIPLAPNTGNVTIYGNASWILSNVFPSTYVTPKQGQSFVTIQDVQGFSSVQVQYIEPSTLIGSATFQTLTFIPPVGINLPAGYTTTDISMIPFGSSTTQTLNTSALFVQIPYGSIISATVYDPWHQAIGSVSDYLVANLSGQISIPISVSEVNFIFYNSSEQYVYLDANNYNLSFFGSAIIANNTLYDWSTSYYSFTTGQQQYKTGSIQVDLSHENLPIYLNPPPAELQINVNAYSGSNLGSINSGGNPRVLAYINNQPYTIGSTYSGYEGTTYNIRITDLLNQTLAETNITLESTFQSQTITITKPSYWVGIENAEQVAQNSTLATEFVSLNRTGSHTYYNFTDSVGQNWVGYFLAGNYTIYMHDNVTNTFFVNISDTNQQRYLNGQYLLNLTAFNAKFNQLLNNTLAIQNTTYGLHMITYVASGTGQVGKSSIYQFAVYYSNGTAVSQSFLQNSSIIARITNSTGSQVSMTETSSISGNVYTITITPKTASQYTLTFIITNGKFAGSVSYSLNVQPLVVVDNGMNIQLTGPATLPLGATGNYYIILMYSNGSLFNSTNTHGALSNMTLQQMLGSTLIANLTATYYSNGMLFFTFTSGSAGGYTLMVKTHVNVGKNVSSSFALPVGVQSTTSNIGVVALDTPSTSLTDTPISYQLEFYTNSGTYLNATEIGWLLSNASISIRNSLSLSYTTAVKGNILYVNFSSTEAGYFTFSLASALLAKDIQYSITYSNPITISEPSITSNGMHLYVSGPSTVKPLSSANYFVTLYYENGTSFNATNTKWALTNLTVALYTSTGTLVGDQTATSISNGIIQFTVNVSAGNYYVIATTHLDDPLYVSASNVIDINAPTSIAQMSVIAVDAPSNALTNQSISYIFQFYLSDGKYLNSTQISALLANSTIGIRNSLSLTHTTYINGNTLYVNFSSTEAGYFTFSFSSSMLLANVLYTTAYSSPIAINEPALISNGMHLYITGSSGISAGNSTNYFITLDYINGTSFNTHSTSEALANLTISLYTSSGTLVRTITATSTSAGIIQFAVNVTSGMYYIIATTHLNDTTPASASNVIDFTASTADKALSVVATDTPSNSLVNQPVSYELQFTINGKYLNDAQIQSLLANSTITIKNTESLSYTTYINSNTLFINFTSANSGYFTVAFSSSFLSNGILYSGSYSNPIAVSEPIIINNGMSVAITGTQTVVTGQTNTYFLSLAYQNGTAFNVTDTNHALKNLTIQMFTSSGTFVENLTATFYQAGILKATASMSSGQFYIVALTYLRDPTNVSATDVIDVTSSVSIRSIYVVPVDTPSTYIVGQHGSYILKFQFQNGTLLTSSQVLSLYPSLKVTLLNSVALEPVIAVFGNEIYINFTMSDYGFYTLTLYGNMTISNVIYSVLYSNSITVMPNEPISSQIAMNPQIITNTSSSVMIGLAYQNGTYLTSATTDLFFANSTLNLYENGVLYKTLSPSTYSASVIFFVVNISIQANFTVEYLTHANSLSTLSLSHLSVVKVIPSKLGMRMSIAGANQMYLHQSGNYTISVEYGNRTAMNLSDTEAVWLNLSYAVLNGLDPTYNIKLLGYSAGLIFFSYSSNITGIYTLFFESHANLQGYASDTVIFPVSIVTVNYGLHIIPLSPSSRIVSNTSIAIIFNTEYGNFTEVNQTFLQKSAITVMMTDQLGATTLPYTMAISGNNITLNFTSVPKGNYTISVTVTNSVYTGSAFYSFSSAPLTKISSGLILTIPPFPNNYVQVNTTGNITLYAQYGNQSILNISDSNLLITGKYLVVLLYRGNSLIKPIFPILVSAGKFVIPFNFSHLANYTIVASVQSAPIGQIDVNATAFITLQAVGYNPSAPPLSGGFFYGILNNMAIVVGLIGGIPVILYGGYRIVRSKKIKKKQMKASLATTVQAMSIYKKIEKQSNLIYANIPISITEQTLNDVLYPQSRWQGLEYVLSDKQAKNIKAEREKGVPDEK